MKTLPLIVLKERVDIPTLFDRYFGEDVEEGMTYCPFHEHRRRTPSFSVFDRGRRFRCFSCGLRGDVIDFTREAYYTKTGERITFEVAVRALAKMAGVDEIPDAEALLMFAEVLRTRPVPEPDLEGVAWAWADRQLVPLILSLRGVPAPVSGAMKVADYLTERAAYLRAEPLPRLETFRRLIGDLLEIGYSQLAVYREVQAWGFFGMP